MGLHPFPEPAPLSTLFDPFFGDMRIKAVSGNQRPLKGPTPSLSLSLSPGLGLSQSFVRILMDDLSGAVEAKIP